MLADQLAEAVQHIEGQFTAAEVDAPDIAEEETARRTPACRPGREEFQLHRGGRRGVLPGKFRDDTGGTVRHRQKPCHRHGGTTADRQRAD